MVLGKRYDFIRNVWVFFWFVLTFPFRLVVETFKALFGIGDRVASFFNDPKNEKFFGVSSDDEWFAWYPIEAYTMGTLRLVGPPPCIVWWETVKCYEDGNKDMVYVRTKL